jgi:hypothetical protein
MPMAMPPMMTVGSQRMGAKNPIANRKKARSVRDFFRLFPRN